jgi:hypothetical protein
VNVNHHLDFTLTTAISSRIGIESPLVSAILYISDSWITRYTVTVTRMLLMITLEEPVSVVYMIIYNITNRRRF